MFNFADLMRQAQGGQALDNIAAATGLSRQEVEKLTATLLPVFALGMQKSAQQWASPAGFADLVNPEKFRSAFDDARSAVSPAMTEASRLALEKMFGSGDAAKVIADQAAAASGVGADVVSRVMPAIAATLFGGIAKQIEDGPFAPFFKAWSGGIDPSKDPMGAFANPFKDAMGAFLKGYAEGKPDPAKPEAPKWPEGMEQFGKMFEAGMDWSDTNRKAFEQILEGYRKK